MVTKWTNRCKELKIPITDPFSVVRILADDMTIREWQDAGLPADNLSTENGILIFNAGRWPLIIDPQNQANKFLKRFQKDNKLQVMKLTDGNFLKQLEGCISTGQPAMLENVEEILDPSLEPILAKNIVPKGTSSIIKLGDTEVRYNKNFRLYLTTKLPNPHYLPEVCIKVTLINFTVTPTGLEDQLLIEVVRFERIELEEKRINLILTVFFFFFFLPYLNLIFN
jgi:dynein heavy chain, axonemal